MSQTARILVVDGDAAARAFYTEALRADGYEVAVAAGGKEALQTSRQQHPDVVLLDVALPDVSGLEVCRQLKADPLLQGAFVILTPSESAALQHVQATAAGADEFIVRTPLRDAMLAQIRTRVRTVVRLRQALAAVQSSEERFRQLTENIREVFWITDTAKSQMIYISPGYEEIWGRTCASLYASPRDWIDALHPEDRERVLNAALEKQVSGQYNEVYRIQRPDGTIRWIQDRAFPIRDAGGRVYRVVGVAEDITLRQQAEEQLRLLADAVQSTQELICITDADNRFTFVNRAMLGAYGYAEKELLGQTPRLLVSPRNPPGIGEQILQSTLAGGWHGELSNRRKDGSDFPVSLSTSLIKDSRGRILGLMGVARDISERRRAERQRAAFAQLSQQLGAAAAPAQAASIILTMASELFGWDSGYVHLYSPLEDKIVAVLTVDTVEGQRRSIPSTQMLQDPSPLMRLVMSQGARLINQENPPPPGVALVPFGDRNRPSASRMYAPIRASGVVQGVLSIQSYTPHQYSLEDLKLLQALAGHCGEALERIKAQAAVEEAEARYRSIFEHATEGIFRSTPAGRILSANPALARMFGYPSPEEIMRSVTDLMALYVEPARRAELKRLLDAEGSVRDFEAQNYRKDGRKIWSSLNAHVVRDEAGAVLYYEGTNRDITERKRAEEELRQLPRHIMDAQEAERLRVARELHDSVNQLIASVKMRLRKVEKSVAGSSPAARAILARCQQVLVRALEENRRIAYNLRPSDLDDLGLATACRNLCKELGSRTKLTVKCQVPRRPERLSPAVELNLFRILQQGLTNIEQHARARTARVRFSLQGDFWVLKIQDDGRGFDTRRRAPAKGRLRGIGLKNMCERAASIGGECRIESRPGEGTTVTVRVPCERPKG